MMRIQKTNRIRAKIGNTSVTIYCSYDIVREVLPHCIRLNNNILAPKKGSNDEVVNILVSQFKDKPKHFPSSAHHILGAVVESPWLMNI